jgi:methylase of polypeptide subunit release factors
MDDVLDDDERFSVIMADPPYVPSSGISRFPEDPPLAIDGGVTGLDLSRDVAAGSAHHILHRGAACCCSSAAFSKCARWRTCFRSSFPPLSVARLVSMPKTASSLT